MRHPRNAGKVFVFLFDFRFPRGANGSKGCNIDRCTGELGLVAGVLNDQPQNVFEAVMTCLVQEIGFGCGEKNSVDPAAEKFGEDRICTKAKNRPGLE